MFGYIGHKLKYSVQLVGFESIFDFLSQIESISIKAEISETDEINIHYILELLQSSFLQIEKILANLG